jgi:hypothetical protein
MLEERSRLAMGSRIKAFCAIGKPRRINFLAENVGIIWNDWKTSRGD